jgi:hypothetical protein
MTEAEATRVLQDTVALSQRDETGAYKLVPFDRDDGFLSYIPGDRDIMLTGVFTADELEAIAVWMRAHGAR